MAEDIYVETTEEKTVAAACGHFREGLNCAECVLLGFLETHDSALPPETVALASGFGGGIGHTKHICGAITGALMALGTQKGRADPYAIEEKAARGKQLRQEVYPRFAALLEEARAAYGTVLCAELTAAYPDFDAPARRRGCLDIVAYCAALAARHAEKD